MEAAPKRKASGWSFSGGMKYFFLFTFFSSSLIIHHFLFSPDYDIFNVWNTH